jgi:hypothetical protein
VIGGDLDEIITESQRLCTNRCSLLVDEAEKLLRIPGDRPGRLLVRNDDHAVHARDEQQKCRQTRSNHFPCGRDGNAPAMNTFHCPQASAQQPST